MVYRRGIQKMDNPEKLATRRRSTKEKHNTICVGHDYAQTNTNNVKETIDARFVDPPFFFRRID
jgi:hypothetical protein